METELDWLALTLIPGVGARTFHRLIQRFGSPDQVFAARRQHLEKVPGLKEASIKAIRSLPFKETAHREMARLRDLGIRIIRWGTGDYPHFLANISDPPPILYVKGTLSQVDEQAVAVVGSRQASTYGLTACKKLCRELAWRGWTVVSGMARGIENISISSD